MPRVRDRMVLQTIAADLRPQHGKQIDFIGHLLQIEFLARG